MNEDRPVIHVANVLEDRQQVIDIVSVDRPDIEKSEFVKERTAGDETSSVFFHCQCALLEHFRWQTLGDLMEGLSQPMIAAP